MAPALQVAGEFERRKAAAKFTPSPVGKNQESNSSVRSQDLTSRQGQIGNNARQSQPTSSGSVADKDSKAEGLLPNRSEMIGFQLSIAYDAHTTDAPAATAHVILKTSQFEMDTPCI